MSALTIGLRGHIDVPTLSGYLTYAIHEFVACIHRVVSA
jgi:hypothetical protein